MLILYGVKNFDCSDSIVTQALSDQSGGGADIKESIEYSANLLNEKSLTSSKANGKERHHRERAL
jgi:hypothetical protein